ncbi:MAG: exodeoxyribonuclease V subunit gamma [Burkholderiaceae bacterium]|nr:exodeoxyribonuclease V subunit gamma [Burkholderiaceae bacterium]
MTLADPLSPDLAFPPGFMVLHGNRLEDLSELLVAFVRAQPLPPLSPEILLVQSAGMKHWLEMALSADQALGICAATRMELPSAFLWQVYRQVLGAQAVPVQMPFDKSQLVWRLLRLLPSLAATNAIYAPLQAYLSRVPDSRKLYQLALQLADVFDGYQSYRADWLRDWAAGRDVLGAQDLDPDQAWQAQLWRDLRADLGPDLAEASRAGVHSRYMSAVQALAAEYQATGVRPRGLPQRIVVFGISSLPHQAVEALAALGPLCQVLMLVQNPCRYYWGDLVEGHAQLKALVRRRQAHKVADKAAAVRQAPVAHPLLASWGKQGRDYLHLLDGFDQVEAYRQRVARVDVFVDPLDAAPVATQLAQLQSGILNLELPEAAQALRADDDSVSLVSCHSPQREVEVLHDRLLAWLDADASLQPREVMVMVPDMERFTPHIQAVFGRFSAGEPRHIPYALADTSPRQSPLVQALRQLLALPQSRISLADWLSLFEVDAVRQRFGLSAADVAELQPWLQDAGVRWGLDGAHRQPFGMPADASGLAPNSWLFGLRRLLLGYALGEAIGDTLGEPDPGAAAWGQTLAQPAWSGLDARLVQALLDWLDAVRLTLQALRVEQTPAQWVACLTGMVARFFEGSDEAEARQIQHLLEPLEAWLQACDAAALDAPLPLEVVGDHWLSQLQEGGLHQRFFGGGVQFGTLMPMRSIPFKIVCLLGMNDGDYPRQGVPRDFDLMAQSWRAGDRSRREDDRYLFLEALLSARDKLYISWQGHRATDNAELPPSVLVAQLIEFLRRHWQPAREAIVQPLQPFSLAYFEQGSKFSTFDADWARVHDADRAGTATPAQHPEARSAPSALSLSDLRQLLRQPVEVFFKARLGVQFDALTELELEHEPFGIDGLQRFREGQDLLAAQDLAQALLVLPLSGRLPMAAHGQRMVAELGRSADVVRQRAAPLLRRFAHPLPAQVVDLLLDGTALSGSLLDLRAEHGPSGECLQCQQRVGAVLAGPGALARPRLSVLTDLWVRHLAASASGMTVHSTVLGLDGQVSFAPLPVQVAQGMLTRLVQAYREAWTEPPPVTAKAAWAYLGALPDGEADAHAAALKAFEGSGKLPGEREESPYLARCFADYEALRAQLPAWARTLYGDLQAHLSLDALQGDAAGDGA